MVSMVTFTLSQVAWLHTLVLKFLTAVCYGVQGVQRVSTLRAGLCVNF